MDTVTIIFRILVVLLALIIGYISFRIYQLSKGALKGWMYVSIAGASMFLWASTAVLFKTVDIFILRVVCGTVFFFMMGYFAVYAYARLADDLHITKPSWLTARNAGIAAICVYIVLAIYNVAIGNFQNTALVPSKLLSIAHFSFGLSMVIACLPTYYIMRQTKRLPWVLAFIFCFTIAIGMFAGQHFANCCGADGVLNSQQLCTGYDLDYSQVYASPCIPFLVMIGKFYQPILLLGIVIGTVSFYKIWRALGS